MQACLENCNCQAVLFQKQVCRKQKFPLRFGKTDLNRITIALVKVGNGSLVSRNDSSTMVPNKRKNKQQIGISVIRIASLTFAFIVLVIFGVIVYRHHSWANKEISNEANRGLVEDVTFRSFTYEQLEKATNNFTKKLGKGAFGTVFKGVLPNGKRAIVVKRLEKVVAKEEVEFRNKMRSIVRTHHKSLVWILSYHHDKSIRLLVYEYMNNGSFANFLFKSETKPSQGERIGIALNIARGILYLHEKCKSQIIHCDINPKNVLIDEYGCSKILDFGLVKLLMLDQSRIVTEMRGIKGYVSLERHKNQPITVKIDVYNFRVMFLEIICYGKSMSMDVLETEVVFAE